MLVALDAMGVIYETGNDTDELLIPFALARGCVLSVDSINALYIECSLGRFSSSTLWERLGIASAGTNLDGEYVSGYQLTAGVRPFLETMRGLGVPIACISNDVAEWSLTLRRRHGLEDLIAHWIISGEVGTRKPDRAIDERCAAETGVPFAECLFVDDRVRNLEAAVRLGFATLQFCPQSAPDTQIGATVAASFREVEAFVLARLSRSETSS